MFVHLASMIHQRRMQGTTSIGHEEVTCLIVRTIVLLLLRHSYCGTEYSVVIESQTTSSVSWRIRPASHQARMSLQTNRQPRVRTCVITSLSHFTNGGLSKDYESLQADRSRMTYVRAGSKGPSSTQFVPSCGVRRRSRNNVIVQGPDGLFRCRTLSSAVQVLLI